MDKKIVIALMAVLLVSSCKISEVYRRKIPDPYFEKEYLFFCIEVPRKGVDYIRTGGELEEEIRFQYSDNSLIYVSNDAEIGTFLANFKNIKSLGDSIFYVRFPRENHLWTFIDTMELSGMDSDSLYWKDVKLGKLSIGYYGVPERKKEQYEKALQTFEIDTCTSNHSISNAAKSKRRLDRWTKRGKYKLIY